ncbi:MAG: MBOAT family protein [Armatimonadia bacterium]|nr:MBOAT family protein [Armatimonadia bacterium]
MLFNSWQYGLFLPLVVGVYFCLSTRKQNWFLLCASYFFYGCWDWRFLSLIWISTAVDFLVARSLPSAEGPRRRLLLLTSVCVNLGILGFFKYFNFFIESLAFLIEAVGLEAHMPVLRIVLPVGISFYTFQTMAYTIDVYRGKTDPCPDLLNFALYVCYFPQLVAGPIERPGRLLPQIANRREVSLERFGSGAVLILIGLFRKVAIADVAARMVDPVFDNPVDAGAVAVVRATIAFGLQIYGDFAGYSDIARGTSRLLGIELMENFNHPYFATNITVFWRRWHVSLSSWLRDYLYIPLGGNRGPRWFVYRNLFLTMLLGGLWHGAGWNFVIWGGIHGLALALHKLWLREAKPPDSPKCESAADWAKVIVSWGLTTIIVYVAWVFFRSPDWATTAEVFRQLGNWEASGALSARPALGLAGLWLMMLVIDIPQARRRDHLAPMRWHWVPQGLAYAGMIIAILTLRVDTDVPFIYFQF